MCVSHRLPKWEIVRFERFRIKCLKSQIVYVGKPRTKTCLEKVLVIAQSVSSQRSRIFKLQEKESFSIKLDRSKDQA